MPKPKQTTAGRLNKYVSDYPGVFTTDGVVLFCKPCCKKINADQKSQVEQHIQSVSHVQMAAKKRSTEGQNMNQQPFISHFKLQSQFNNDLVEMLIACDIPLSKLTDPTFVKFIEKYTEFRLPSQSNARDKIVNDLFDEKMNQIRSITKDKYLWGTVDETTDASGRYIANFLVGVLSSDLELSKQRYLINTAVLDRTNHATIAKFVDESLSLLGTDFKKDNFLLLVTDAAPYMLKAAGLLRTFYVNMIHLTCLAHGLHRVCEFIRSKFESVDKLISNCKKVFLKSPSRTNIFREKLPGVPLPPRPVITRWGTWMTAAFYYAQYFNEVKEVLDELQDEDCAAIPKARDLLNNGFVQNNLAFLLANYSFLPDVIEKLEKTDALLTDKLELIEYVENELVKEGSVIGNDIKNKFHTVLQKNPGFRKVKSISAILNGTEVDVNEVLPFTPHQIALFKFAPV